MHFLSPYMLLTLIAIPVLIIIHTLKPKPSQIQVANLFMWQEALKERSSHLSFERLSRNLPLLLQILIVILAALALARPSWTYLGLKKGDMILVIDTSASMKTRSGSGTRFDQARKKILELIDQRIQGQKILIVEAGAKAIVKDGFLKNSNQARIIVKKLQPSDAAVNLEPALYLALSFVDPAKMDVVYLITDGAGGDLAKLIKNHPDIRPIIISGGEHNAGITKFEFRQQIDRSDRYEFMLEVKNFSLFPLQSSIRLSIDNVILFDNPVTFEAREKKLLVFPYMGLISGIAKAALEIDDDLTVDNQAYLSLNAAKNVWILLVSKGNYFLEKLLAAYPNFRVNSVKEIIPSSWPKQAARHDIVIVDRMDFPETGKGNFLLIDSYSPSIPVIKTGKVRLPEILNWKRESPLTANVNLSGLIIEESKKLRADKRAQPLIESSQTGLMYSFAEGGLRAVLFGFDFSRSDLPLKVAFPVIMSNIFNWLNPHKLEFSISQTQAGKPFDIYLKPQTDVFYTRAPQEKWQRREAKVNPYRYRNTHKVGVYTIAENDRQRYFTVNLTNESESDIASTPPENLSDRPAPRLDKAQIYRQPLWMPFILIGCGLLMIEWYLWLKMN